MKGYPITFNIYAENEQEAEQARNAIVRFITAHAQEGRAVSAKKIEQAVTAYQNNPFVKSQVNVFFR